MNAIFSKLTILWKIIITTSSNIFNYYFFIIDADAIKVTTTGNCSEVTEHDFKKKCSSWLVHAPDRIKNVGLTV